MTDYYKPLWSAGGLARASYDISMGLVKKGNKVSVYTTNYVEGAQAVTPSDTFLDVDGTRVVYFESLKRFFKWEYLPPFPYHLFRIIKKDLRGYDIIHIHDYRTLLGAIVSRYSRKMGVPYILQAHGSVLPFFQKQGLKKVFDIAVGREMLSGASAVIAVNDMEAEQYQAMGVPPGKIVVIPNGVHPSDFDYVNTTMNFKEKYHIREDERIILYLGRINRIKGLDLLLSSFLQVKKSVPNVKLVIAGPDDGYLGEVQAMIKRYDIIEDVVVTGGLYGADKVSAYHSADVYALPSKFDIFGITVLESLASGTPVVVTKNCGIHQSIDGRCGIAADDNPKDFGAALIELLSSDLLRTRFSLEGREIVRRQYDWVKIVDEIEALYVQLMGSREHVSSMPAVAARISPSSDTTAIDGAIDAERTRKYHEDL